MAMIRFTQEEDERLIDAVRRHPCLWDAGDPDFKNTAKREANWIQLGKKLKKSDAECKKRWKSIRDHFRRQQREHRDPDRLGIESSSKKKRANYWDRLTFLDPQNDAPGDPPPSALERGDPEFFQYLQVQDRDAKRRARPPRAAAPEDDVDLFFKTTAATVKKFTPDHIIDAKRKIFEIVCNIELSNYRSCHSTEATFPAADCHDDQSDTPESTQSTCSAADNKPDLRSYCVNENGSNS